MPYARCLLSGTFPTSVPICTERNPAPAAVPAGLPEVQVAHSLDLVRSVGSMRLHQSAYVAPLQLTCDLQLYAPFLHQEDLGLASVPPGRPRTSTEEKSDYRMQRYGSIAKVSVRSWGVLLHTAPLRCARHGAAAQAGSSSTTCAFRTLLCAALLPCRRPPPCHRRLPTALLVAGRRHCEWSRRSRRRTWPPLRARPRAWLRSATVSRGCGQVQVECVFASLALCGTPPGRQAMCLLWFPLSLHASQQSAASLAPITVAGEG